MREPTPRRASSSSPIEGLGEVIVGAAGQALDAQLPGLIGGDDDDIGVSGFLAAADVPANFSAGDIRHGPIQNYDLRIVPAE